MGPFVHRSPFLVTSRQESERELNSRGTEGSENAWVETERNRFRFMHKESDHANTDEAGSNLPSTAVDGPVLVHRRGILLLRAVQVLSSWGPWVPIVLCEVCELGLSRLVLGRRRCLRACGRSTADPAAQAAPRVCDSVSPPDQRGDDAHRRS